MFLLDLTERGMLPDWLVRVGIRRLLAKRIRQESRKDIAEQVDALHEFIQELSQSPVAIDTDAANAQHYEVPTAFFQQVLGSRLKYSPACFNWFNTMPDLLGKNVF